MQHYLEPVLAVLPLLTFFAGLVLGHRLAVSRDRRREFNDAALPVRAWLLYKIERKGPFVRPPSSIELDTFLAYLWPRQRLRFRVHYEAQRKAHSDALRQDEETGNMHFHEASLPEIKRHLKACLRYTARR